MRILDQLGNELESVDYDLGYVTEEKLFKHHHEAIPTIEEVWHYEYEEHMRDGKVFGRTRRKVIDVPGVPGREAWDEYEDILRYTPYTPEELEERKKAQEEAEKARPEYRIAHLEQELAETKEALEMILAGVTE